MEALYALFRGDLRGLLKALDEGVGALVGLAGTGSGAAGDAVRPLGIAELRPVLQQRYAAQLAAVGERVRVEQLTRWGREAPEAEQTQKSLGALWKLTQGAVSAALTYLIRQGYVVALPRASGAEPIRYVLSGVSRLIFG